MNVSSKSRLQPRARRPHDRAIYDIMGNIFQLAKRDNIPTYKAADRMAEERIAAIGRVKLPDMGQPSVFSAGAHG